MPFRRILPALALALLAAACGGAEEESGAETLPPNPIEQRVEPVREQVKAAEAEMDQRMKEMQAEAAAAVGGADTAAAN